MERQAAHHDPEAPAEVEVLDLTPRPGLPGVVYVHSIVSPEPIYLNPDDVWGFYRLACVDY